MKNVDDFIEKYKYLEKIVTEKYNLTRFESPIAFIEHRKEYSDLQNKISYCREVRNFLQHEGKIDKEFAIIPSNEMIKLIDTVINRVENPLKCSDICVPIEKIFFRQMGDGVYNSIKDISHRKYTHIPILKDGVVIGVFSKSSLLNYLIDNEKAKISLTLKFNDITKYISTEGNESEKYLFASIDAEVDNIKEIFEMGYYNARRIAIVFLTKKGSSSEKLLGLLTPYDLIK